jgi:acyl carrier protein
MDAVYEKLTGIFKEVFNDPQIIITPESTADDIVEWDSMTHINLILMIELRFDIEFNQKEMMSFQNVGIMAECIKKKIRSW